MGLRINTNVSSLNAQKNMSKVVKDQSGSLEKMASGNRINKAADDAAGLAISEKMKAELRGNKQAHRNANDAISMVQTAEGGLNEVGNILIRMRELAVQASSDTVGDTEREYTQLEYSALTQEIDRISNSTKFNGIDLLNGDKDGKIGGDLEFQVGVNNKADTDRLNFNPKDIDATAGTLKLENTSIAMKEQAQSNLDTIDTAINAVNGNRASLGAFQNRLGSTITNLEIKGENLATANSRIRDTDYAGQSAELAKQNILSAASSSVLSQANTNGSVALKLIG